MDDPVEIALCDNWSGTQCLACRGLGLFHCAYPEECGELKPMQHHEKCHHWAELQKGKSDE